MFQQQVDFAVFFAEHEFQLFVDVVQAGAVGDELQTVFAADLTKRQAAADDFQADAVFFDIGTAQVRIGQPLFAGKFDVVFFAAADGLFLFGYADAVPCREIGRASCRERV